MNTAVRTTSSRSVRLLLAVAALAPVAPAAYASTSGTEAAAPSGSVAFLGDAWDSHSAGSLARTTKSVAATKAWMRRDAAGRLLTGAGVGVGIVDTGIAPVAGLDGEGKVVNALDVSFEAADGVGEGVDTFGHGTHIAGIIAGRDADVRAGREGNSDVFVGVAPDARLVNLKVAGRDGATDVTQIIAAIDFAVAHKDAYGIRVLNLSLGRELRQDSAVDPLATAAQHAWRAGIVVVASAGNDGGPTPLLNPAIDPYVIAVGASDDKGTEQRNDDTMASFSNAGTSARRPDLLAPGRSIASLRVPGSTVDAASPAVPGVPARLLGGTGTSQAAAIVSGAAALLLQARPELTPDQVKALLVAGATPLPKAARGEGVPGVLDVAQSLSLPTPDTQQQFPLANGLGSIELARGGEHLVASDGTELAGEIDVFGRVWDGSAWATASAEGTSWVGLTWRGLTWRGLTWRGLTWRGLTWRGLTWRGLTWR